MPELPEVEAARLLIERNCLGKKLENIDLLIADEIIFGIPKTDIQTTMNVLEGHCLIGTGRYGKYLWLSFSNDQHILMHFGMTGFLQVQGIERSFYRSAPEKPGEPNLWPPRFTRFVMSFSDNVNVAFGDARRLGRVKVIRGDVMECESIMELGFDPLLNLKGKLDEFAGQCRKRNVPIKALLLDQTFTAGVGNWMADDILYMARIHPEAIAASLKQAQVESLFNACINLSQIATKAKLDGKEYPQDWLFHVRWDRKVSKTLTGQKAAVLKIGGRSTVYVPSVQRKTIEEATPVQDGTVSVGSTRKRRTTATTEEH